MLAHTANRVGAEGQRRLQRRPWPARPTPGSNAAGHGRPLQAVLCALWLCRKLVLQLCPSVINRRRQLELALGAIRNFTIELLNIIARQV
jgi:hypothetical protein